jgi:membrane dipeptidase
MFIFDAHLDLSLNSVILKRDLTRRVAEIRAWERESGIQRKDAGRGTVALPDMRRGKVGLCVATQIGHVDNRASIHPGWPTQEQAWAMTQGQLAWYRVMEACGELVQIRTAGELERHLALWEGATAVDSLPIGYVLSLEGADSIYHLSALDEAVEYGLRALGPAHYGPGIYANGTDAEGGFNEKGKALLRAMDERGLILDVTHLCDECFWEALNQYSGDVWASHNNCRAIVPHNRQFSDEQIRALLERDAVIGVALDAWMVVPGWIRGETTPESSGACLEHLADHVEHICEIAGNARHVGIGSDLDGGYGLEQTPQGLDTIADVQKLLNILEVRGFDEKDRARIAHGNFIRFLRRALPV